MNAVPAATTFAVDLQLQSTSTSGTITPTVSITTYYDTDKIVNTIANSGFSGTSFTNTNR